MSVALWDIDDRKASTKGADMCSYSNAGRRHGSASAFLPVKSDSYTPPEDLRMEVLGTKWENGGESAMTSENAS